MTLNPTQGRVKFGVSSGDPDPRIGVHRRAGYTEVVRVIPGLPTAHALEQHIKATLRDAGHRPVLRREYFDIGVLALVLDVVDGWVGALAAAEDEPGHA